MTNEEAAKAFAEAFDPPLQVVKADRIDNVPTREAYCAAGMVADGAVGVTGLVFGNGHLKAYVEFVGARDMAGEVGAKFAKLTEIWDAEQKPKTSPVHAGSGAQSRVRSKGRRPAKRGS